MAISRSDSPFACDMEVYVLWVNERDGQRLRLVDTGLETAREAEQAARQHVAQHRRGVAYILKAVAYFIDLSEDDSGSGQHRLGPWDDSPNAALPITDLTLADIETYPQQWRPRNPHYAKNPANTTLTVRSWFRQMRAADFERDLLKAVAINGVDGIDIVSACHAFDDALDPFPNKWTLFDTQKVVDRETAAHYLRPTPLFFVYGWRVVGKIENLSWSADYRYRSDPVFHRLVDGLVDAMRSRLVTFEDISLAMGIADRLLEDRRVLRGDPASPGAGRAEGQ